MLDCAAINRRRISTHSCVSFAVVVAPWKLILTSTTTTALLVIALGAFTNERRFLLYTLLVREDLKQRWLPQSSNGHFLIRRRFDH